MVVVVAEELTVVVVVVEELTVVVEVVEELAVSVVRGGGGESRGGVRL